MEQGEHICIYEKIRQNDPGKVYRIEYGSSDTHMFLSSIDFPDYIFHHAYRPDINKYRSLTLAEVVQYRLEN